MTDPDYPPVPTEPNTPPDQTPPMPPGNQIYEGEVCESCQHTAEYCATCGGRKGYWPWTPCYRCQEHIA